MSGPGPVRATPVALVAGGLYEALGPDEFWERPGVAPALRRLGWPVHVLPRVERPASWDDEARHLAHHVAAVGAGAVALVAASNGCSAALRLALDRPDLVDRLVLCWPATGDDAAVDRGEGARLRTAGADDDAVARLLDGGLVRGVGEHELLALERTVTLVPAEPDDAHHQRRTVAALRRLLPRSVVGLGTPPSVAPGFTGHLPALVALLDVVLTG